jgi:hypothetical protein
MKLGVHTYIYIYIYIYHGTWAHLNGALFKSLPSVCVYICVSLLSLLGNASVKTLPRQRIHTQKSEEVLDASLSMLSASRFNYNLDATLLSARFLMSYPCSMYLQQNITAIKTEVEISGAGIQTAPPFSTTLFWWILMQLSGFEEAINSTSVGRSTHEARQNMTHLHLNSPFPLYAL